MSVILKSGSSGNLANVDTGGNLQVGLGNAKSAGALVTPSTQLFIPTSGLDDDYYLRPFRTDLIGTLRTTSEKILWHDAFEGSNINKWWTQSLSTLTISQSTGVLTMNNGLSTSAGSYAIITSKRQFLKTPLEPLVCRFRARINSLNSQHSVVEIGLGSPSGTTAIISDGAFFRMTVTGTMQVVIAYNGQEVTTNITAPDNTNESYNYTIIVYDDAVRFILQEPNGSVTADQVVNLALTNTPAMFSVSHLPSFARVYVDATGGGNVQQWGIASHEVRIADSLTDKSWAEVMSGLGRQANMNPITQAQNAQFSNSAPGGGTPSNTAALYTTLGGEFIYTMTAASENPLSIFAFQIPAPYTFYLTGIFIAPPVVSTAMSISTTAPVIEFGINQNCASTNLSTGGGVMTGLGIFSVPAINSAVGTILNGQPLNWRPKTPIVCLPGTYLHILEKVVLGGAVTTGAIRGVVVIDGYFE